MSISSRVATVFAGLAVAFAGQAPAMAAMKTNLPAAIATPQFTKANCGNARVCAFIQQGGGVSRAKNVSKVTNPGSGVYCITPKSGIITRSQVTPLTTVEYSSSSGANLLAMYSEATDRCPSTALEVLTFDSGGNADNNVSFFIVVN